MKRALGRFALFAVAAVLVAAVLIVPALLINWYESTLPSGAQLVPWLWDVRAALCFLPFAGPVFFGYWLFTRGRLQLEAFTKKLRIGALVFLMLLAAGASFAADLAGVLLSDDFIFATPQPRVSAKSPNGKRVAHLTFDCFLGCAFNVFVEERGQASMSTLATGWAKDREAELPSISWIDDEKFKLAGGSTDFAELVERTFP